MNGKQILLDAIQGKKTPRPAWLPFVGVHGGNLIGKTATEYLHSSTLIATGLKKAHELYNPDGLPVVFDLQVEAQILGCDLHWADEVPPSVISHPLESGCALKDLPSIDETKGRFPVIIRALDTIYKDLGANTAIYGLICGPFTLALHLLGNSIFMDILMDPDKVKRLLAFCAGIGKKAADIYLDHGADVIAVVDPMTSQIGPDHFAGFIAPAVNEVFDHIRSRKAYSSIFVCGDVTRNLEEMVKTRADHISVDEQIDMAHLRALCNANGKSFGGNIKLTSVLLLGDEDDARLEVADIIDKSGERGFILSPGCDLPYRIPEANLRAVAEMVHDEDRRRLAKATTAVKKVNGFEDIVLPDYSRPGVVTADVITLDSTSCAPCQYMMEAIKRAARDSSTPVEIREHKIKAREGIGMMVKLGVSNLPTICLDGAVAFASIIPDHKTLVRAIEDRAAAKNSP